MDVIAKHDSSLILYNSSDATRKDTKYGNGEFTCSMKNINRAGSHAIKVVPYNVFIPNVFPNIITGTNDGITNNISGTDPGSFVIPQGFFTITSLLELLNTYNTGTLEFAYDPIMSHVTITNTDISVQDRTLNIDVVLAKRLGLTYTPSMVTGTRVVFTIPAGGTLEAGSVPHMATTPIAHVLAYKAANFNLLSSNRTEYSVLASVNMSKVPYGEYAVHEASDIFIGDIEYRTPRYLGDLDFKIVDADFNTLIIDERFPVLVELKVYHGDTQK